MWRQSSSPLEIYSVAELLATPEETWAARSAVKDPVRTGLRMVFHRLGNHFFKAYGLDALGDAIDRVCKTGADLSFADHALDGVGRSKDNPGWTA